MVVRRQRVNDNEESDLKLSVTEMSNVLFKGYFLSGHDSPIDMTHCCRGPRKLSWTVHHWVGVVFDGR